MRSSISGGKGHDIVVRIRIVRRLDGAPRRKFCPGFETPLLWFTRSHGPTSTLLIFIVLITSQKTREKRGLGIHTDGLREQAERMLS